MSIKMYHVRVNYDIHETEFKKNDSLPLDVVGFPCVFFDFFFRTDTIGILIDFDIFSMFNLRLLTKFKKIIFNF